MPKPSVSAALTAFAEALDAIGIAPEDVEVSLPLEPWQKLARRLDEEQPDKAEDIGKINVAGVRYLIRYR